MGALALIGRQSLPLFWRGNAGNSFPMLTGDRARPDKIKHSKLHDAVGHPVA